MTLQARQATIKTSIDHRSRRRHKLQLEVEARASGSPSDVVTVYDISDTGLLIETNTTLDVGEMIEVNLPQAGVRLAEVLWASGRLVGCRFNQELSQGAISAARLGSRFTIGEPDGQLQDPVVFEGVSDALSAETLSKKLSIGATLWSIIGSAAASWALLAALTYWIMS